MKKILSLLLLVCLTFGLTSCGEYASAYSLLDAFSSAYGLEGTLYHTGASEGQIGYMDEAFYEKLYARRSDPECDFAVFLTHSAAEPEECALFIAKDDTSRLQARDTAVARVDFLRDMGYGEEAVVIVRGDAVFYSTLRDGARAERIWRDIRLTL